MPPSVFVDVAVKVTDVPEHDVCVPAVIAIETDGVTAELTVIVIPELVAVAALGQVAFVVITHLITFVLTKSVPAVPV